MVHESAKVNGKSKIAVVGLMFKIGRPDRVLSKVTIFFLLIQTKEIKTIKIHG